MEYLRDRSTQQVTGQQQDSCANQEVTEPRRPVRRAMTRARDQVSEWAKTLRRPPEDVEDKSHVVVRHVISVASACVV